MANQTLSEPNQKELFEIRGFDVVLLPRVSVLILITGNHWIPSNSQQYVWLEDLLTVSQFKISLMTALLLTMTYIEIEDALCGSCCWERHPDLAQCSVEAVDEACKTASPSERRVVQSVHRRGAVTSKTSKRNSSSPTLEALGSK